MRQTIVDHSPLEYLDACGKSFLFLYKIPRSKSVSSAEEKDMDPLELFDFLRSRLAERLETVNDSGRWCT